MCVSDWWRTAAAVLMTRSLWPSSNSTTRQFCIWRRSPSSWLWSASSERRASRGKVSVLTQTSQDGTCSDITKGWVKRGRERERWQVWSTKTLNVGGVVLVLKVQCSDWPLILPQVWSSTTSTASEKPSTRCLKSATQSTAPTGGRPTHPAAAWVD